VMCCDGEREGEETLNMSEIASQNFLGKKLPFRQLAGFPLRARRYPHLTALSSRGEVASL